MIKANVLVDFPKWKKKIKNPEKYLSLKLKRLQKKIIFKKKQEFSIMLTNNYKIKKLNQKFRKKNKITDVLSFPSKILIKKYTYIGDIAISFEFINKRSNISNFKYEFDKMWIHGLLHLLGYDHKKDKDYKKMHREELKIFNLIEKKFEQII